MAYSYDAERADVFSENGQVQFLSIRDRIKKHIEMSGCVSLGKAIADESGDTFQMLACVDRLVEIGEIVRIENPRDRSTQGQIIVRAK